MKRKGLFICLLFTFALLLTACKTVCEQEGHNYDVTSNNNGTHTLVCLNDAAHTVVEECSFGEWVVVKEATLFEEGKEERVCSECNYKEEKITVLNHHHEYNEDWTIDVEATYENVGSKSRHCILEECDSKIDITEVPKLPYSDGLLYELNSEKNAYIVVGIKECNKETISITPVYNNLPVVEIGKSAFENCSLLVNVEIPSSVTCIQKLAFKNCGSLQSVNIPTNVTKIDVETFYGCTSLISIEMPNSIESIESSAFENCSLLMNIEIPSSVMSIKANAFKNCSSLQNVNISTNVTKIDGGTFHGCTSLISIEIPSSVTSIGFSAFRYCSSLTSITIPFVGQNSTGTGQTYFGYIFGANLCEMNYNFVPPALKEVIITNEDSIAQQAFKGCAFLESIKIYSNIVDIKNGTFSGCTSLKSIELPSSVKSIEGYAFSGCNFLENIKLPNGLETIGTASFRDCHSLESIEVPSTVTSIGYTAFYRCFALEKISIPFVGQNADGSGFTSFEYIFAKKDDENNPYYIPSTLKEVVITGGKSIGDKAFSHLGQLTSVKFANGLERIGERAFEYCIGLTTIEIPDSVEFIGGSAFYGCSSLISVRMSSNIKEVESSAFGACEKLEHNLYDNAYYLGNDDNLFLVLVKAVSEDITACVINENTKVIQGGAFGGCSSLTSIEIPNNIEKIGKSAFNGCSSLIKVDISDGLKTIGKGSFIGCRSLTSLVIPSSVTTIEESAFYNCSSLKNIIIPSNVENIEYCAFYTCELLTIYCEVATQPSTWDSGWNISKCPVVWDYKNQ